MFWKISESQVLHDCEGEDGLVKSCAVENSDSHNISSKEFEAATTSCSISHFWWVNANLNSEEAAHLSFFPEYFESTYPLRTTPLHNSNETYSSYLDCPPRNLVSVGPEHQACITPFNQDHVTIDVNRDNRKGTCVIPMPDLETSNDGHGDDGIKTQCNCRDKGSIRCVKDHVREARERLKGNLGLEMFEGLGLCEMGEEVAGRWSREEEDAFKKVVISYPESLVKNFWDHLSAFFPCRMHSELVSYYFNVFMLRKRAEQNRLDPLSIDSDNDEWWPNETGNLKEDGKFAVENFVVDSHEDNNNNNNNA